MIRKYGKKASEKIARTMHEFKRGKLRSGGGRKVTSRRQAVAIGVSQARRAGYKVPLQRGHATMSLDARVRGYLSNMRLGTEIDACGIARALGGVDPLEADYALERAVRAGQAVTRDGRWFGPAVGQEAGQGLQAEKTPPAQLQREIAEALSRRPQAHSRAHATRKARAPRIVAYRLKLTPEELRALTFARGRYEWPDMLLAYAADDGSIAFTENEMGQWIDDVDSDTMGGHAPFPLAGGALSAKLQHFYDSRV